MLEPELIELIHRVKSSYVSADYPTALTLAQRLSQSGHTAGFRYSGIALRALGRHSEAVQALTEAFRRDPTNGDLKLLLQETQLLAQNGTDNKPLLLKKGFEFYKQGQYTQALEILKRALNEETPTAEIYCVICDVYLRLHQYTTALGMAEMALRADPGYPRGWNRRGECFLELKDWDRALADFNEAIRRDGANVEFISDRGNYYVRRKDLESAWADAITALRLDPSDARGWNLRGICFSHKGMHREALKDYEAAVFQDPKEPIFVFNRGSIELLLGHTESAIADARRATEMDPSDGLAWNLLGAAFMRVNLMPDAKKAFDEAILCDAFYANPACAQKL
eukprot:Protomagalhaensia_sp_Gyna_25__5607@NODE_777_length_2642_cov_159_905878_g610_i0_p2_GENE_NODE_777_length_2642_cov_159_905878_g610_i0NODE_777_length_2642_cov_159_905878_g610_i0_p2_ORF_typecomplete_len339_score64_65TPR_16/PF13432_6/6_3e06TPR_16/PF13432_6/0_0051TPR_16/PF13432_6/7e12TPR_16/PF13432_6/2_5e10TPR_16/PF13432_6/3_5e08TPR_19/PF14559_6/0_00059TPR_19/PF14559_6/2_9e08TPR_19/PF14559_6/1_1e08TPR_19/PF14559_6/1e05TPR_19/PF14559_6/0_0041TPR_19/PF14559_6/4_2e06TPR_19/PF14559_6/0_0006TPR_1/PF00515_28